MNDQEEKNLWQSLRCAWQAQKSASESSLIPDEQIAAMRNKITSMHHGLNKVDFWGLAIDAVVIAVFTISFFATPHLISRIGIVIIIGDDLCAA